MNLHGIVASAIAVVNPWVVASIEVSTGYTQDASYNSIPSYEAAVDVDVQKQPLTSDDLRQLDGLNVQGEKTAFYMSGTFEGVSRAAGKGGDLITLPDGTKWLVVQSLEKWPDWSKVACVRQI